MRVAIIGAGSFAKHFVDEFPRAGHEVVLLTRSAKDSFTGKLGLIEQRVTDYSDVDQLTSLLDDCDAAICTLFDYTHAYVDVHLALIEACRRSRKCKRFIPSEFGGNAEDFEESAGSLFQFNLTVRKALRAQSELEWTVASIGWLADYLVQPANRYHADFPLHPLDLTTNTFTIPGTGDEKFATTCCRDAAAAIAQLLHSYRRWREFTYVQGEQTTWNEVVSLLRTVAGLALTVKYETVAELESIANNDDHPNARAAAAFKLYVPRGHDEFDQQKVARDRAELFSHVHFRSIKEILEAVKRDPATLV